MNTFRPYIAGSRRKGIGTGWRQRQDDAAALQEQRKAEAQDERLKRVRVERHTMYEASRLAEEAARAEQARHELVELPRELAGHVQSNRARKSFHPYLIEAVERYLTDFPQFRPKRLEDSIPDPMTNDEFMKRHAARHGLPVQSPAQQVLEIVEPEPVKRGRGRPPKQRVETTDDGAILDEE